MSALVKVCGLRRAEDVSAAVAAGANFIGFVFFDKSPRAVSCVEAAELSALVPEAVTKVGLFVDADDELIASAIKAADLDILQLHGSEDPERVQDLRIRFGLPVMKAIGIRDAADVEQISEYLPVADMLLIDAKPPKDAVLPGGNGVAFDWRLIAEWDWHLPWMLAGGLSPDNAAEAVKLTQAPILDVSSGVEAAPGEKDADLMRRFIDAVA